LPYLAIKKVKGRYYGYMQESYREGGSVRTRTVEYLGAMEPAVAQQVQATRKQLGAADMAALVKSVREASAAAIRAPETPTEAETVPPAPERTTEPPQPRYEGLTVNGKPQLVDMKTGELIEPQDKQVITTETNPTLRPFTEALKLPAKIETHKLSRAALHGTHRKSGERLKRLKINPATMPDVVIKYGHPDGLKQRRDGSYIITTSRKPKRGHTLNKTALWRSYRQALSHATLDSIEAERPELFAQLQSQLSESHKAGKRLLFDYIAQTNSGALKIGLSLQLLLWDRMTPPKRQKGGIYASAADLGQMSFDTVNDWRSEAALILAEAHKDGWQKLTDKTAKTVSKQKATITKKRPEIDGLSTLDKLAGKRRKLLRDILEAETKLKASQNLSARVTLIQKMLDDG